MICNSRNLSQQKLVENTSFKTMSLTKDHFHVLPNNSVLLSLPFDQRVYFKGRIQVESVLRGDLLSYGGKFNQKSSFPIQVFSPKGYSLVFLQAAKCSPEKLDLNQLDAKAKKFVKKATDSTLVILSKLDLSWQDEVENKLKYSDSKKQMFNLFGREDKWIKSDLEPFEKLLDVNFVQQDQGEIKARLLEFHDHWEYSVQNCLYTSKSETPRLVGIGGKGVGKSTMLKYMTNRLIQELQVPVIWIDFDPGQAELTLPGCLSCTILGQPNALQGPNFSHLNQEVILNIYLGSVNVSDMSQRYMKSVEHVIRCLNSNPDWKKLPWIVNTMGFNRGLGIALLKKTLTLVKPTTCVEIKSRFAKKNYECSIQDFCSQYLPVCNYMSFEAMPENSSVEMTSQDNWGIPEPFKLRDIVILSYLEQSSVMSFNSFNVNLDNICYQLLQCSRPPLAPELVLNTALVSLGKVNSPKKGLISNDIIVESLGFGVVCGIDKELNLLYLKTALKEDQLKQINCLTAGSIFLPPGIFQTQKVAPYVQEKSKLTTPLNVPWQRSAKPRIHEFQQNK